MLVYEIIKEMLSSGKSSLLNCIRRYVTKNSHSIILFTPFFSHHGWYTQLPFTVYTHECHVSFTWYMHSLITYLR